MSISSVPNLRMDFRPRSFGADHADVFKANAHKARHSFLRYLLNLTSIFASVWIFVPSLAKAQDAAPLAYIRTVLLPPVATLVPMPRARVAPSPRAAKAHKAWVAERDRAAALKVISEAARAMVQQELAAHLGALPGTVVSQELQPVPMLAATVRRLDRARPDASIAARLASRAGDDACLVAALDYLQVTSGLQRVIWLRAVAWLVSSDGKNIAGPFYGVGHASAARSLFKPGYTHTDMNLVGLAAREAVSELVTTLDTGRVMPFAQARRAAIVPASIPAAIELRVNDQPAVMMSADALVRLGDVLFQPETGPLVQLVAAHTLASRLAAMNIRPADIWSESGNPILTTLQAISHAQSVDLVFATRITRATTSYYPSPVGEPLSQPGDPMRRALVRAEALLYSKESNAIIWNSSATGETVAHSERVRGALRLSPAEECVSDAARIAYARLRYNLQDYIRRYAK